MEIKVLPSRLRRKGFNNYRPDNATLSKKMMNIQRELYMGAMSRSTRMIFNIIVYTLNAETRRGILLTSKVVTHDDSSESLN